MKVFLDTNVLVSAVATRGLCADVLREVLISHHLIVSAHLLAELEGVFRKKLNLPENLISEFLKMIQQDALFSTPSAKAEGESPGQKRLANSILGVEWWGRSNRHWG